MSNVTIFSRIRDTRTGRIISAFLALNLLAEIISPSVALALTSGPAQPEFSSFEPVATTDMVNDFSGDFTYNIPVLNVPGPDGGGYSMSLSYHSGSSSQEEASWVGFGWTLNPGAINRNKRGYADEFNGVNVVQYNKTKPSWTQNAKFDFNMELVSKDQRKKNKDDKKKKTPKGGKFKVKFKLSGLKGSDDDSKNEENKEGGPPFPISVSLSKSIKYNNYSGFSISSGISAAAGGMGSVSMNKSGGNTTLGFSINPLEIVNQISLKRRKTQKLDEMKKFDRRMEKLDRFTSKVKMVNSKFRMPSSYTVKSYNAPALAYSVAKNSASSWNFSASMQINPNIPVGFQIGMAGNMHVQAMEAEVTQAAYGYMYSSVANTNTSDNQVYDYQIEKETTFNKHDKNLGIPFNNADVFSASGNNVIGGFKLQHDSVGSFYPNFGSSVTKIRQLSVELGIGATFQIGIDLGIGKQTTSVSGKWPKTIIYTGKEFAKALPKMRFTNDMGGELNYKDKYDSLRYAKIYNNKELDLSMLEIQIDDKKKGNTTNVDYKLNSNSIDELHITNKDGSKSHYTTPVYTKNELQLTIGLDANKDGSYLVTNPLHITDPLKNKTVVGNKIEQKYAASYLLTSNTTVNYVDVSGDGVTEDDLGGWTKFDYRRVWGGSGAWYRFRVPYNGLNYNGGRMLDLKDQTGSMSAGEKEVYYLKCIETKSHIAFFVTNKTSATTFTTNFPAASFPFLYNGGLPVASVTANIEGSGVSRFDGLDAAATSTAGMDPAAESLTAKGTHELEKLERIVLFAKSDLSRPLTTTVFEYDYSLCQGIPNTLAGGGSPANERGKLTLKKVWTESNGVARSQIAPYQFHYEYFNNYPNSLSYYWINDYNQMPGNDANQNPMYAPEQLDAWGYYQENGEKRFENMQPWLSQKTTSTNTTFDPAAWQMKRIQLPSGGEIHVHYEQKDYSAVQDKIPMAMVSLVSSDEGSGENGYKSGETSFVINTDDINVGSITTYSNSLYQYFIKDNNKLYFKVLYAFCGDETPKLNSGKTRYEYVTGYTTVNEVSVSGGKIHLHLGDKRNKLVTALTPAKPGKYDKTLPRFVCYQELMTNGGQNLGLNANNYKDDDFTNNVYSQNEDLKKIVRSNVLENTMNMFFDWVGGEIKNVPKKEACKSINYELSYFKLPVYHAKKGGGIRVKRILTFDPGIESGDAGVFGSEYIYEEENGSSSGVASNEPGAIREENALVTYLERKKQKVIDKILNGRDTKQFEGFLGESILPAAEVSHSRIVIKNIRDGVSTSGYAINRYHTVKDYPMEVEFSDIGKKNGTYKKLNLTVPIGMFNMTTAHAWVTQGYIFKMNDMHGKIASKTTYPGIYNAAIFSSPTNSSTPYTRSNAFKPVAEVFFGNPSETKSATEPSFTSKTTFNYSAVGDSIPSLLYDKGKITKGMLCPGTEEDFTIFTSTVKEKTNDFSIEVDLNLSFSPPALTVGFGASFNMTDNLMCQHVTSKIVSKKSYLLSTTNVNDGVTQTTENLAFDRYTGDPVLTRTFDGYMAPQETIYTQNASPEKQNGHYYSLSIPASWVYPAMGPASQNSTNANQLGVMAGNVVTYGTNALYETILSKTATATTWTASADPLENVVSASATVFENNWFSASMASDYPALANPTVLTQANSYFYPARSYTYRDLVADANATNGKIYQGGLISSPFSFFDWANTSTVAPVWYSDSKVTMYSPYGYPIEEVDALAIKSSAQFGYKNTLPTAVAQNAAYSEIKFIDFEHGFSPGYQYLNQSFAHSGRTSYDLTQNPNYVFIPAYNLTTSLIQRGLSIKLWLKSAQSQAANNINYRLKNPLPNLKASIGTQLFDFKAIAQTGDWTLYSADIRSFNGLTAGSYNIALSYNYLPGEQVLVDDLRLQPLDASMNCSVYYSDNKLAAQFDDQHFGVFYEYNNMGQLVRKSIETERGKKTLQEQQYNTPLKNRQ